GITRYSTDYWSAYTRHLAAEEHSLGKRNTQHIERKHLTLRTRTTRLVRTTIGFSHSPQMHDLVIGLFVKRSACGLPVCNRTSAHLPRALVGGRPARAAATAHKPIVHFVGSIPLPDAETVFRTLAASAAPHLKRLPDGETGIRKTWIRFLQHVLAD